uniref:HYPK_UBA domain-containing protein n=1 Tax=Strongyloides papillosus TaxID=174720 RepID=A0A0N5BTR3_STREA
DSGSHGKKEDDDNSEETEEDKQSLEITRQTIQILSEIDAVVNPEKNDEINSNVRTINTSHKRKSNIYNSSLYQGDIMLAPNDALELIEEAEKVAREKNVDITSINAKIKTFAENLKLNLKGTSSENNK